MRLQREADARRRGQRGTQVAATEAASLERWNTLPA